MVSVGRCGETNCKENTSAFGYGSSVWPICSNSYYLFPVNHCLPSILRTCVEEHLKWTPWGPDLHQPKILCVEQRSKWRGQEAFSPSSKQIRLRDQRCLKVAIL